MAAPTYIIYIFLFALGASTGSFLNVLIYRMPRDMSITRPSSHCPACKHPIAWYYNLPIFAWFILRGRCRYCRAPFSIRYPLVELLTALLFVTLYWAYFCLNLRDGMPGFAQGGFLIYAGHIVLISALLACSLIDAEHWIIPLQISYSIVIIALILSMIWPYCLEEQTGPLWRIVPYAPPRSGALALGALLGLALSGLLLKIGLLKRSFDEVDQAHEHAAKLGKKPSDFPVNNRREIIREMVFLGPVVLFSLFFLKILCGSGPFAPGWENLINQQKWCAGLLGSVFGFMIGGGVVWATRIIGTLAFGREAMGLGDVHLMAAVGAMLGWISPTIAFFVAPFIGLGWAVARLILHRAREIPYGPFLSAATVIVMLAHDPIVEYFRQTLAP